MTNQSSMACSLLHHNISGLRHFPPMNSKAQGFISLRQLFVVDVSAPAQAAGHRRLTVIRASNSPVQSEGAKVAEYDANPSPAPSSTPFSFDALDILPPWAKWLWGGVLLLVAIPSYRRLRKIGDQVEETAAAVVDAVEHVAEATEKISAAVADALPEGPLKEVALKVQDMADAVDKDVDLAQDILEKIDELEEKVDSLVEEHEKEETTLREDEAKKTA